AVAGSAQGDPVRITSGDVFVPPEGRESRGLSATSFFDVKREYSSTLALVETMKLHGESSQSAVRQAIHTIPYARFSPGWVDNFEHWLVEGVVVEPGGVPETVYIMPSRSIDRFTTSGDSMYGGHELYSDLSGNLRVVQQGSTEFVFEPAPGVPNVHRLSGIEYEDGETLSLTYYSSASAAPCTVHSGPRAGRLCMIEDTKGAWVRYSDYSTSHGYVTQIESEGTQSAPLARVEYDYTSSDVRGVDSAGVEFVHTGKSIHNLTKARFQRYESGSWIEVNSRAYSYTRTAYYRPDLAGQTDQYQDPNRLLVTGGNHSVLYLRVIRNHDSEFVLGHEYDDLGRGAASISAGEFMRFEYIGTALDIEDRRVVMTNESSGEVVEATISDDGTVMEFSDECACSSMPGYYERSADGSVTAEVSLPPGDGVDDPLRGIRTTYERDAEGRATLVKSNTADGEDPSTLPTDPTSVPMSVIRNVYDPNGPALLETGPVYSAICLNGTSSHSSLSCPADATFEEPRTIQDFDTGADAYDSSYNASIGSRMTQQIERGLTVTHLSNGDVEWQSRVRRRHYLSDGRLDREVSPSGTVTQYDYHGAGSGSDSERLWRVSVDGVLISETGGYDDRGNAGWVRDVQSGITTTTNLGLDGRTTSVVVSDGSTARTTFYEYDVAGHLVRTRRTATGLTSETPT
ncbi:MAG: hypothetical protein AAFX94_09470, partial [Myxococcota bacterium]